MTRKIAPTKPGGRHVVGPGGLSVEDFARWYRRGSLAEWDRLDFKGIAVLAGEIIRARENGRTIFVLGNGGSAAAASHWATDLSKTAHVPGQAPIRCLSLTENSAYMTAVANDGSFDEVFSRQLENLLAPRDLVILISGSGNSKNLIGACRLAGKRGAKTAALVGFDGGRLKGLADVSIHVPSDQYGVIEDIHGAIGHILTFYIKQKR